MPHANKISKETSETGRILEHFVATQLIDVAVRLSSVYMSDVIALYVFNDIVILEQIKDFLAFCPNYE